MAKRSKGVVWLTEPAAESEATLALERLIELKQDATIALSNRVKINLAAFRRTCEDLITNRDEVLNDLRRKYPAAARALANDPQYLIMAPDETFPTMATYVPARFPTAKPRPAVPLRLPPRPSPSAASVTPPAALPLPPPSSSKRRREEDARVRRPLPKRPQASEGAPVSDSSATTTSAVRRSQGHRDEPQPQPAAGSGTAPAPKKPGRALARPAR